MSEPIDWARVPARSLADARLRKRVRVWEAAQEREGRTVSARNAGDTLVLEAWQNGSAPATQARTIDSFLDHPGLTEQIAAALGFAPRPWRPQSVRDAMGVPAIHRAVTLISNVGGGLSMEAFKNGAKMPDDQRPRLIVRPDPFHIPRDFYRDTFYSMATHGEGWWWVAKRGTDNEAIALIVVPAQEIQVSERPGDLLRPIIQWRGEEMPNEDMIQITLLREVGALRGYGPLQACGAAVSVAVEAEEWAANFFAAGGYPNIWIKVAGSLGGDEDGMSTDDQIEDGALTEVMRLKEAWVQTAPNTPRITDDSIEDIKQFDPNPQGAQMLAARSRTDGETAQMFGIPGKLLEYMQEGGSLTYQNLSEVMTEFLRTCLIPNYLEPVEQTMSDLLPRSIVSRFNVRGVNRADIKTRYEVYEKGIASGVLTPEMAQMEEGIIAGDVELSPAPPSPPAAFPSVLPVQGRASGRSGDAEVRCDGMRTRRRSGVPYIARCEKLLSTTGSFVGTCPRCKKVYATQVA